MTALNCTRAWRPKLDRWGAFLLFHNSNVLEVCAWVDWSVALSLPAGGGLSPAWQRPHCFYGGSGGWDEVPDDPHALACDAAVLHRTGESQRTFPFAQHWQGLHGAQQLHQHIPMKLIVEEQWNVLDQSVNKDHPLQWLSGFWDRNLWSVSERHFCNILSALVGQQEQVCEGLCSN